MDWEYRPDSPLGKRSHVRLKEKDLADLFDVQEIPVKIATATGTVTGRLLDISEGGVGVSLATLLAENVPITVGLFLGKEKVISKAVVRRVGKVGSRYTTGIMFIDLVKESAEYIAGIYASKVLRHSP